MATRKQWLWHVFLTVRLRRLRAHAVDECERGGRFIYFWSQHEDALIKDLVSPELHADSINTGKRAQTRETLQE